MDENNDENKNRCEKKVVLNEKKYYPLRDERNRDENKGEN